MTGWIIGWFIACGIAIANAANLKAAGLKYKWQRGALFLALAVIWPIAIGWAIGKGISVTVNLTKPHTGFCQEPDIDVPDVDDAPKAPSPTPAVHVGGDDEASFTPASAMAEAKDMLK